MSLDDRITAATRELAAAEVEFRRALSARDAAQIRLASAIDDRNRCQQALDRLKVQKGKETP